MQTEYEHFPPLCMCGKRGCASGLTPWFSAAVVKQHTTDSHLKAAEALIYSKLFNKLCFETLAEKQLTVNWHFVQTRLDTRSLYRILNMYHLLLKEPCCSNINRQQQKLQQKFWFKLIPKTWGKRNYVDWKIKITIMWPDLHLHQWFHESKHCEYVHNMWNSNPSRKSITIWI